MRNRRFRPGAKNYFSAGSRGQLAMPADKISVKVSFYYVFDLEILRGGFIEILVDIALRIDDHGFAIRTNQIRSMSETIEIKLFEVHRGILVSGGLCALA